MSEIQMPNYVNVGWVCPMCGKSMAPWVSMCPCKSSDLTRGPWCENSPGWPTAEFLQEMSKTGGAEFLKKDES
jgi:hypothetical protein